MLTKQSITVLKSLIPLKSCVLDWKLIGMTFIARGNHGVFEIEPWRSGSGVSSLLGQFASDEGSIVKMSFEFEELLASANPRNHPSYDRRINLHLWEESPRNWDWYIAVPASLEPLHNAINAWVSIYNNRRSH